MDIAAGLAAQRARIELAGARADTCGDGMGGRLAFLAHALLGA
jgi:hypothetical protein